jgi:hypothetical protein
VKQIFAVFTQAEAHLVRLWVDSWAARGWAPQLISAKEVEEMGSARRAAVRRCSVADAQVVPLCVLNFNCPVTAKRPLRPVRYGKRGWLSAGLVRFPVDMTEDRLAGCGRTLCLAR